MRSKGASMHQKQPPAKVAFARAGFPPGAFGAGAWAAAVPAKVAPAAAIRPIQTRASVIRLMSSIVPRRTPGVDSAGHAAGPGAGERERRGPPAPEGRGR